ncbi:hypothetical protein [Aliamphritea spongicola]|uniref:hypothetical protein n=1 Tax=Aliamphritea spongicola TaxID=707589 RepID=UPI00196AFF60|nr:hypothetical protein [Aliamphritea spongicola]MBN3561128.1 hypothetical protein [Aliamphritea spongicola]
MRQWKHKDDQVKGLMMQFDWKGTFYSRFEFAGLIYSAIAFAMGWYLGFENTAVKIGLVVIVFLPVGATHLWRDYINGLDGSYVLIQDGVFHYAKPKLNYEVEFPVADIEKIRVIDLWVYNALILNIKDRQYLSFYFHDVQAIRQHLQTLRPELSFR